MPQNPAEMGENRRERPQGEFTRAEKWLRENKLAQVLLEKSNLDEKILKTMLLYYWSEGATFEELAEKLRIQRPGAWKRWKKGRGTIMRSFYTVELAIYAGILEVETAELLVDDLVDYIGLARGGEDLSELRDRIEKRMVEMKRRGILK